MENEATPTVGNNAGQPGAGEQPPASGTEQKPPIEGEIVEKLFSMLEGKFTERFNDLTKPFLGQLEGLKTVQGNIDRSQQTFKEQLAQLQKYKDAGLSDEEALAEMESDSQADQWKKSVDDTLKQLLSLVQGGNPNPAKETVASVFAKYGLDVKSPLVAPALAKQYKDADEMKTAALELFYQIKTSPSPNAAQAAALNGGEARQTNKKDISGVNDSATLYNLAAEEITG